ncbi:hypothetical protein KY343_00260 [Candidatus Woesearchaeota archaeon]|nr:hypothetical protein [Candidatus Woesearchaeota archaeon]
MCFYNYKFRSLIPSSVLSWSIEKDTDKLKTNLDSINEIFSKTNKIFENLKKANTELTKLAVQSTRLKEKQKLKDMYKEKEEIVLKINKSIAFNTARLFNRIDFAVKILEKIVFNADAFLYKESKRLNKFITKIEKLDDKKLSQALLNKIELVKEDIKTTARRLYEISRAGEEILEKYPEEKSKKIDISEEIKKLEIEAADMEKTLKHLAVTEIDHIYTNAEKLLEDLRRIELDAVSDMPKLEMHFTNINSHLYLLDNEIRLSIKKRSNSSKENFTKIKKKIAEHAKNLLQDIEIVKKIK